MFAQCSIEEKRELLRLSRIRLGLDTKIPREKATDSIVERGLYGVNMGQLCTMEDINKAIAELGLMKGLRKNELSTSLDRLYCESKVEKTDGKFGLSKDRIDIIENEIREANRRLEAIVGRVYITIINKQNKKQLFAFFLEFISIVFAQFGEQWIKCLCGKATQKDFLKEAGVESIFKKLAGKHRLPKVDRGRIKKLSVKFLYDDDPTFNYLKFNLAQSFYITKILCVDTPIDLLSKKIFENSTIYLDTNIIFSSLLTVSRHNITFKELVKICGSLNVKLCVSNITKDEVERVASYLEKEVASIFEEIPEGIAPKVKGSFFEAYIEQKKVNPDFCTADLFRPFHDLKNILKNEFSIEIIDDKKFDLLFQKAENDGRLQKIFNDKSVEIRNKRKGVAAIAHDIFHYFLVGDIREEGEEKTWFLTLDTSLPYVAIVLQKDDDAPFCFALDVIMHCFSLFITDEQEVKDFSELFSRLISNQLFPVSQLFDVRDFVLFNDIGVKISELSEDDVEESLYRIKKYVLKGKVYSHSDFDKVAYELKKIFLERAEKGTAIQKHLDAISEMQRKHREEIVIKDKEIHELRGKQSEIEGRERRKILKRKWNIKLLKLSVIDVGLLFILGVLSNLFAEGKNLMQKIINFWPYFLAWGTLCCIAYRWVEKNDKFKIYLKREEKKENKNKGAGA